MFTAIIVISSFVNAAERRVETMVLRLIGIALLAGWLAMLLVGRSGGAPILLLNALGILFVDLMTVWRTRMNDDSGQTNSEVAASH